MERTLKTARRRAAGELFGWPLFAFLLILTVMKGIRMPSRWAVTHYLFTYQMGFTRRGLWGELLRRTLQARTSNYFVLATVGLIIFALFLLVLVRLCRDVAPSQDRVPLLLVLLASPGLAFFAHLTGYLEQVVYLALLVIFVAARRQRWNAAVTLAFLAALILPCIHEASILWVGALTLLALLAASADSRSTPSSRRLLALLLVAGVWVASTAAVVTYGRLTRMRLEALRDDRLQSFEFRLRTDAFQTLTTTLSADLAEMRARWADPNIQVDMILSLAVFAPGAIYLGVLAGRRARAFDPDPTIQNVAMTLVVLSAAGPLLLHAVGRDAHRWNALAALDAGLAALVLCGVPAAAATAAGLARRPRRITAAALMVCIWGVAADPSFFDMYGPNHPPFQYNILFLRDAILHPDRNNWLPARGR